MSGNSFGKILKITTCGESHGSSIVAIVDGVPSGISLSSDDFVYPLSRRKTAQSKFTSQRQEDDIVEIISGVFEGKTTGCPIGLQIKNKDAKSKDYSEIKDKIRPGHADYTYWKKYGIRDYRGGGRSSARETTLWVAAGVIANKIIVKYNVDIFAYVNKIGNLKIPFKSRYFINKNIFFIANNEYISQCEKILTEVRKNGDSIGASIQLIVKNTPVGLGRPVFDKLDAKIAMAMMSINAVKGVSIGDGFESVSQLGSIHRDEITHEHGFLSNHCGGILGGISTGQDIIVNLAFKSTSSILKPAKSIDTNNNNTIVQVKGRHDPCVGLRAVAIVEAMMAIVLADEILIERGSCNESRVL